MLSDYQKKLYKKKYYHYVKKGTLYKYSQEVIDNIRKDYATGEYTLRKLKEKYGVSHEWIRQVIKNQYRKTV